jgi:hypothetical protein
MSTHDKEPVPTPVAGSVTDEKRTATPEPDNQTEDAAYPSGLKLTLIMVSLCMCVFLVALDQTIIAPALGAITADYKSVKDIVSVCHMGEKTRTPPWWLTEIFA